MQRRRLLVSSFTAGTGVALALAAVAGACGDEHATVRERLDGSAVTPTDAPVGEAGTCNVTFPTTYDSPNFETNAASELGLRRDFADFVEPMNDVEAKLAADAGAPAVTKDAFTTAWAAGTPSVKSATTAAYQARVAPAIDAYITALGAGAYSPEPSDGGGTGGIYGGFVFDPTGLDLHQIIEKGSYVGTFYNQAQAIIGGGSLTVGSIDRLVAAFGASPAFPNSASGSGNTDVYAAALAARRDAKDPANPGPYQRIKSALIKAKATVAAGPGCAAELSASLKIFLSEWEKSSYATVIFDLNDVITRLSATPPPATYGPALHSFGEAVALIEAFKGIDQSQRIINDAQIDGLLSKIGAPDGAPSQAYNVALAPTGTAAALAEAIQTVKSIYGFSDDDVTAFEKDNP